MRQTKKKQEKQEKKQTKKEMRKSKKQEKKEIVLRLKDDANATEIVAEPNDVCLRDGFAIVQKIKRIFELQLVMRERKYWFSSDDYDWKWKSVKGYASVGVGERIVIPESRIRCIYEIPVEQ